MLVFAGRVKHALDVAVQRSPDTDARKHRRSVKFRDQQQRRRHRVLALDSLVMYVAASRSVTRGFPAGARDRIDKPLIPRHEFAFAPNWWRNEGIWHGQQAF